MFDIDSPASTLRLPPKPTAAETERAELLSAIRAVVREEVERALAPLMQPPRVAYDPGNETISVVGAHCHTGGSAIAVESVGEWARRHCGVLPGAHSHSINLAREFEDWARHAVDVDV